MLLAIGCGMLAACGGRRKKTTQSCGTDQECVGGICFENACYTACQAQSECTEDQFCVTKARGDGSNVAQATATYFTPLL